ncbi:MAG: pilus assembly protein TadG-related protein [Acidimicrobiales bacterium]
MKPERDERGTILFLVAMTIPALVIMAALVFDLGNLRGDRRAMQRVADLVASAAGPKLSNGDFAGGCTDAFTYLKLNLPAFSSATSPCGQLPTACVDAPATPVTQPVSATVTAGTWTATFRRPVADADIADTSLPSPDVRDGTPCQRFKVTINHADPVLFAGIVGIRSWTANMSATVRANPGVNPVVPAMWLLDPQGCISLSLTGGSHVTVGTSTAPGVVAIDSDGTACTGQTTTLSSSSNSVLLATGNSTSPGAIDLNAMPPGAVLCSDSVWHECASADVSGATVQPQPKPQYGRATRAPADYRYNCKTGYPLYQAVVTIPDCPTASSSIANVDALRSALGVSGSDVNNNTYSASALPSPWTRYHTCKPIGLVLLLGDTWIDCPGGLSISTGTIFSVGGNVVLDGTLKVSGSGSFTINPALDPLTLLHLTTSCLVSLSASCVPQYSAQAAYLFQRAGDVTDTGGPITLTNTVLVQNGGCVKLTGGSPPSWTAPTEGPFAALALWGEGCTSSQLNGGGSLSLAGTFFTPDSAMTINGGAPAAQQQAQFISRSLAVSGGATLTLVPNVSTDVPLPAQKGLLIR